MKTPADNLTIELEARTKTFDVILKPVRAAGVKLTGKKLDKLVDAARTRHHRAVKRKRRRG